MVTTLEAWTKLDDNARKQTAEQLASDLGGDWEAVNALRGSHRLAAVRHRPSGQEFVAVPGGTYTAGIRPDDLKQLESVEWAEEEATEWIEQAAEEAKPREVTVSPFLCARAPLLVAQARSIVGDVGWVVGDEGNDASPIRFTKEQCAPILQAIPWRLPTSIEWEWVAREGGTLAFINGATPEDADGACSALYDVAFDPERNDLGSNGFGAWGMPWGDWVATADAPRVPHAGRGGAAMLYPWQGDELIMQLAGMADDGCANKEQCLRFVVDLPAR